MVSNSSSLPGYRRPAFGALLARLAEPRRFIQAVAGPRQVGKTTLVRQVVAALDLPTHVASADDPGLRDRAWLDAQWEAGRSRGGHARGNRLALSLRFPMLMLMIPAPVVGTAEPLPTSSLDGYGSLYRRVPQALVASLQPQVVLTDPE